MPRNKRKPSGSEYRCARRGCGYFGPEETFIGEDLVCPECTKKGVDSPGSGFPWKEMTDKALRSEGIKP